jgi:hypothetical protein
MSSSEEARAPRVAADQLAYSVDTSKVASADDYAKIPRKALARVNAISERKIFWGMILTVLVVIAGMTRGIFG